MGTLRRVTAAALLVCVPSCFLVVTKERTSEVRRVQRWNDPIVISQPVPQIVAQTRGGGIDIQITWKRLCDFTGDLVIDYRKSTGATVKVYGADCGGGEGCGYIWLMGIIAAPFTLAFSGLITAVAVGTADDTFETKAQPLPTRRGPCDMPGANLRALVSTPGREPTTVTTDGAGRARVELGDDMVAMQSTVQLLP